MNAVCEGARGCGPRRRGLMVESGASATYRRERAHEVTLGTRVKDRIGPVDYRAEGGLQVGTRASVLAPGALAPPVLKSGDVFAYHGDLELGLHLAEDALRVAVEGVFASGDKAATAGRNEGWHELYPTAHKFLGLSDAFVQAGLKRTNVASGVAHLTVSPTPKLTAQVDGHLFARVQDVADRAQPAPRVRRGYAGAELDAGVAYTLLKGLKLRGLYAIFVPGDHLYPAGDYFVAASPVHYAELELRYDLLR